MQARGERAEPQYYLFSLDGVWGGVRIRGLVSGTAASQNHENKIMTSHLHAGRESALASVGGREQEQKEKGSNRRLEFQLCAWFGNGCSFALSLRPAV